MDESEIGKAVYKDVYKDILDTLKENLTNMTLLEIDKLQIKRTDLEFIPKQEDTHELMKMMFRINNWICNEYRKRYGILKTTNRLG
jgi:hypothetical protein